MVGSVKDYMVLFVKVFKSSFHLCNCCVVGSYILNLIIFIFNLFLIRN